MLVSIPRRRGLAALLPLLGALAGLGCVAMPDAAPPAGPYVLVLGTAQDGGLPQIGCRDELCVAARRDAARRRGVASLLVADPRDGRRFLVDASPDLPAQVERASGHPPTRVETGPRPPLFDAVFLTHAHIGHYLGLVHFGREVYGARDMPLHVSARMADFLADNGPWNLLVETGAVRIERFTPGRPIALAGDLSLTPLLVPHRDEYSDTVGFVVRGPRRALLYVPDIDKWERWGTRIEDVLAEVDVALLDGTFYDGDEVPGRDLAEIPHPFLVESLARFAALPSAERAKIHFTHLNHSNPATMPGSAAARAVRAAGMAIAQEGERFDL